MVCIIEPQLFNEGFAVFVQGDNSPIFVNLKTMSEGYPPERALVNTFAQKNRTLPVSEFDF
jgi:hypothetical protein